MPYKPGFEFGRMGLGLWMLWVAFVSSGPWKDSQPSTRPTVSQNCRDHSRDTLGAFFPTSESIEWLQVAVPSPQVLMLFKSGGPFPAIACHADTGERKKKK